MKKKKNQIALDDPMNIPEAMNLISPQRIKMIAGGAADFLEKCNNGTLQEKEFLKFLRQKEKTGEL